MLTRKLQSKKRKYSAMWIYSAGMLALGIMYAPSSIAQVKIGSNPTIIGANSNLEVEAANGNKTVIQKDNGNVGIGTDTPAAKLHVGGNQILGTAVTAPNLTGNAPVVRDKTTGELKVLESTAANDFLFTAVTYQLNNCYQDFVADFDTKILGQNYSVIITGVDFRSPTGAGSTSMRNLSGAGFYNPLNFRAVLVNGTWRLRLDYSGGYTYDEVSGTWTIDCMIVRNSVVKQLPIQTINMGGVTIGAAPSAPAGL